MKKLYDPANIANTNYDQMIINNQLEKNQQVTHVIETIQFSKDCSEHLEYRRKMRIASKRNYQKNCNIHKNKRKKL